MSESANSLLYLSLLIATVQNPIVSLPDLLVQVYIQTWLVISPGTKLTSFPPFLPSVCTGLETIVRGA